ncbi:MAG: MBL fold metallo-hydrolase [Ferrovibrio sp.]|uniref:MBL fold metallo-hydrolase n=1 Tax=Ferrovibrio sp. TaxID=1917215 RepID=UPI002604F137|nr:MBL fold metallo-hydrolase [Ferrovibrio sp.]MCW0234357.1 MBL fold metallo-hydrolase [Ferrovibrio sp.]
MARAKTVKTKKASPAAKAAKPKATKKAAKPVRQRRNSQGIRIRMYRQGVGDCFLLRFPRKDQTDFSIMIDCGVHTSQSGGSAKIREIVQDILDETGGHIDVIVATHEHDDHISGFRQARELFEQFTHVGEIWQAWTEDTSDPLANKIATAKGYALAALDMAHMRMKAMGLNDNGLLENLLGFYGGGSGKLLRQSTEVLLSLSDVVRYHKPGDPPIELEGMEARVFVLGPPRDEKLLKKNDPSKSAPEVYGFAAYGQDAGALTVALKPDSVPIFGHNYVIPLSVTKGVKFFERHYWADRTEDNRSERDDRTQDWRRLNEEWQGAATSLALKLDSDTNNTSLVLAIELGPRNKGGPVLLFAADAQVGNWLSWQNVVWEDIAGRRVTGPDLLRRTKVYKVGHHASHNATLQKQGLELMTALDLALIPTDAETATKVGWGTLPWQPLLERLEEQAGIAVIRTDKDGAALPGIVVEDPLYYEITV